MAVAAGVVAMRPNPWNPKWVLLTPSEQRHLMRPVTEETTAFARLAAKVATGEQSIRDRRGRPDPQFVRRLVSFAADCD